MDYTSTHIDNLIARYLAGEASTQEAAELLQWMDQSPENKKYFEGIRFVHEKSVASYPYTRVNTENAWNKLSGRIHAAEKPEAKSVPLFRRHWLQIAASVLILLGISALLYRYISFQTPKRETIVSANTSIQHTFHATNVVLNKKSKITFTSKSSGKYQELTLEGEAFIEVHHSSDTILVVKADETLIRDIGTSFNVKAYPGGSTVEVYVEEGEVVFYTENQKGITLKKGETGIYNKQLKQFSRPDAVDVNIISYKTRFFIFNHTKLKDAVRSLNAVYTEQLVIANPAIADCEINVTFDQETLESVVDILSETLGLQVSREGNSYVLNGTECLNP